MTRSTLHSALIGGATAFAVLAGSYAVLAQSGHGSHGAHGGTTEPARASASEAPSTAAFRAANARMHAGMDIAFTGKADVDFVRGMIPHHQGAIEMAKVVLAFGKDPEVRKLAEAVISAQQGEIAWMQEWLKKNAAPQ